MRSTEFILAVTEVRKDFASRSRTQPTDSFVYLEIGVFKDKHNESLHYSPPPRNNTGLSYDQVDFGHLDKCSIWNFSEFYKENVNASFLKDLKQRHSFISCSRAFQ